MRNLSELEEHYNLFQYNGKKHKISLQLKRKYGTGPI